MAPEHTYPSETAKQQASNKPSVDSAEMINLAKTLIAEQMPQIFDELRQLVAFESVHSVPHLQEHNDGAAAWVTEAFRAVGIPVEPHTTSDGSKAIIGVREAAAGYPTILLYSHFDVQPAGVLEDWTSSPWELTERNGRWYGRGAADCKGHVVLHLAVLRALAVLADSGFEHVANIGVRVVVEGSEERGGYGLEDLLTERPELFAADAFLIADSGNDELGEPALCTALRGSGPVVVRTRSIEQPVHSGLYGGAAPDALLELIRILSTLHDANGLVAVPGLEPTEHWNGNGPSTETFAKNAGVLPGVKVLGTDQGFAPNDLTVTNPSITVTALDALPVADAVNAVPATAAAHVSLRVPPGRDAQECQDLLVQHIESIPTNCLVEIERDSLAEPFSADTSGPHLQILAQAMSDSYGKETVKVASGGSIPLTNKLLSAHPQAEVALYGISEPSCMIHSADESVSPEEIRDIAVAELLYLVRAAHLR